MPAISVILPVYNGEKYLREAVSSILNQTFNDFEFIIVNDASSDNSHTIIQSYTDDRIIYLQNSENQGLVGALNRGIRLSTGKYIARMDQDDIAMPERFKRQFEFMESHPGFIICGTQVEVFEGPGKLSYPLYDEECRIELIFAPPFAHPTVMILSSVLKNNNIFYREKFKDAEDYGLWTEISLYGKMANLPFIGLLYRRHSTQYTNTFKEGMSSISENIRKNYLDCLSIRLEQNDQIAFDIITKRKIDYEDSLLILNLGKFLGHFPLLMKKSGLNQKLLRKKMHKLWKRICGEYEKRGKSAYRIFNSSPAAYWGLDFKQRLSLLKNLFLLKN